MIGWSPPAIELYPERSDPQAHWLDPFEQTAMAVPTMLAQRLKRLLLRRTLGRINALEAGITALPDADLPDVVFVSRATLSQSS